MQLANVKSFTETFMKQDVNDVVISVPLYFTNKQRQAMLDAAKIAGLRCYRVINDTTATALSYGILRKKQLIEKPMTVMFMDMGYGDFQVAIVQLDGKGMTVKGTAFDANLGGYNFDERLANFLNKQFVEKHKVDLRQHPKSWIKLLQAAEKAKKTMSPVGVNKARINLECIYRETDFRSEVTIEELEQLTADLMPRVRDTVQRALDAANMKVEDLSSCEATGGSIRMRFVKKMISDMIGSSKMSFTLNQDECTARGCAIMSAILSPKVKVLPYDIADAVEHSMSVRWRRNKVAADGSTESSLNLFQRMASYPKEMQFTLKRTEPFRLSVMYDDGDGRLPKSTSRTVGVFDVDTKAAKEAIEEAAKEGRKNEVRIFFEYDASGLVHLKAADYMRKNKQPEPEPEIVAPETPKESKNATEASADSKKKETTDDADANDDKAKDGADNKVRIERSIFGVALAWSCREDQKLPI